MNWPSKALVLLEHYPSRKRCPAALVHQKKKMLRPVYKRGYGVWIREASIVIASGGILRLYVLPQQFTLEIQNTK